MRTGPGRKPGRRLVAQPAQRGHRGQRWGVLAVSAALVLSACTGDGDTAADADGFTESASESASPTPGVPEGVELTASGTDLEFGQTASVMHQTSKKKTVLDLTVKSAQQGSKKDFSDFILDNKYKKRGNYYYVKVKVENAGKKQIGDIAVPLWGISGENTLLRAVKFKSKFKKCPTQQVPKKFKPGNKFSTCLVYLSPNKGSLEGVSYRPTEAFDPIEWRGEVTEPKKKNKKKNKGAGKKNKGGKKKN